MPTPAPPPGSTGRTKLVVALVALLLLPATLALAELPQVAEILEPALGGAPVSPADVHMEAVFSDADGDGHKCSDWEIWAVLPRPEDPVWEARCATGAERVHIHLGDGTFVNSHAGRSALDPDTEYELRVRFRDDSSEEGEWSDWKERRFRTAAAGPQGNEAEAWTPRPGYAVEVFAENLQLPVNIAMVPDPAPHPSDPFLYVTELYGNVKVITRDGTVHDFATGLLNFDPTGHFPGSGEMGVTGIVVDPASGDVLVSLVYAEGGAHYPKVVRLESDESGLVAIGRVDVLDMKGDPQGASHQISNLTISPAGELYVHNGDGGYGRDKAPLLGSYLGKVLRMTLDGDPLADNPFYTADGQDTATDYVWAKGFRNPFGGAWRISDGSHYMVENGPAIDRLARVVGGEDYGWPADDTMSHRAAYRWSPPHAPVNIDFVEPGRFGGSGFPFQSMGHAFVTESGPTYAPGLQAYGKRVVEFDLDQEGGLVSGPTTLVEYSGIGRATAVGLAAGSDGLYFTDLYKDTGSITPIDRGANVLRVYYCGNACPLKTFEEVTVPLGGRDEADRVPPVIEQFRLERKVFAPELPLVGRTGGSSAVGRGTAFSYSLSESAVVEIEIRSLRRGWRVGGKCRPLSERVHRAVRGPLHRRCVLPWPRGTLRGPGEPGWNRRPFAGRLGHSALPAGPYRAVIRARDAAGNVSKSHTARFRVVHRRLNR